LIEIEVVGAETETTESNGP